MSLPLLGLRDLDRQIKKLISGCVVLLGRSHRPVSGPESFEEAEPPDLTVHEVTHNSVHGGVRRHPRDPEEGLQPGCGSGHVIGAEERCTDEV